MTKKITITSPETDTITLNKGKTMNLKVALTPITSQEKIVYSIKNKKIANITQKENDMFSIKAKKKGTTSITIKSGSKSVSIVLKVK